ncbi:MAG: hypothetical protein JO250_05725 [Armatimonadetes bacterium]|nr:hypothetical protein [Armatimonadota bacterium]
MTYTQTSPPPASAQPAPQPQASPQQAPAQQAGCQWTATSTHGVDTVTIHVHGVCQEPTPGYKLSLTRVEPQGADPATLLLYLQVIAPTGIEPQHVVDQPVDYTHTFVIPKDHVPSRVVILTGGQAIPVHPAP